MNIQTSIISWVTVAAVMSFSQVSAEISLKDLNVAGVQVESSDDVSQPKAMVQPKAAPKRKPKSRKNTRTVANKTVADHLRDLNVKGAKVTDLAEEGAKAEQRLDAEGWRELLVKKPVKVDPSKIDSNEFSGAKTQPQPKIMTMQEVYPVRVNKKPPLKSNTKALGFVPKFVASNTWRESNSNRYLEREKQLDAVSPVTHRRVVKKSAPVTEYKDMNVSGVRIAKVDEPKAIKRVAKPQRSVVKRIVPEVIQETTPKVIKGVKFN